MKQILSMAEPLPYQPSSQDSSCQCADVTFCVGKINIAAVLSCLSLSHTFFFVFTRCHFYLPPSFLLCMLYRGDAVPSDAARAYDARCLVLQTAA